MLGLKQCSFTPEKRATHNSSSGRKRKKIVRDGFVQTRLKDFILKFPDLKQVPSTQAEIRPDQGPWDSEHNENGKFKREGDQMEGPVMLKRLRFCKNRDPVEPFTE